MSEENQETETPEVKSYTQEEVDKLVSGLKSNNEKLLSEKKAAQSEKAAQEEEARAAREEAARKGGEIDQLEQSINERHAQELSALNDKLTKRDNLILGERNKSVVNDLASAFIDDAKDLGKTILNNMVETSYNDEGQPVTKYKDQAGNLLSTDLSTFKEYLTTNKAFSSLLKGVQMSGGGASEQLGNNSGASVPKSLADCNGDRVKEVAFYKSQKLFK